MERLSDTAVAILNALHTERLDYQSEYLPLIDAATRLVAYEDIGLEPEEYKTHADALRKLDIEHMHDLLVAERDGRLVVLPCKVGQTIYEAVRFRGGGYSHINPMTVAGIHIGDFPDLRGHKRKSYLAVTHPTSDILGRVSIDKIGKTVFLSRAEAEAALEVQKGESHETDSV